MAESKTIKIDLDQVSAKTRGKDLIEQLTVEIIHMIKRGQIKGLDAESLRDKYLKGVSIDILIIEEEKDEVKS